MQTQTVKIDTNDPVKAADQIFAAFLPLIYSVVSALGTRSAKCAFFYSLIGRIGGAMGAEIGADRAAAAFTAAAEVLPDVEKQHKAGLN